MDLKSLFQKKPKALDASPEDTATPLGDAIAGNEAVKKKQMLLLGSAGAAALIAGSLYIFDDGAAKSEAEVKAETEGVSLDEMVNKNMAEKEWRAQSEAQIAGIETELRTLGARAERADQLEQQLSGSAGESGGAVSADTQRILSAYQAENDQLRAALDAALLEIL